MPNTNAAAILCTATHNIMQGAGALEHASYGPHPASGYQLPRHCQRSDVQLSDRLTLSYRRHVALRCRRGPFREYKQTHLHNTLIVYRCVSRGCWR